MRDRFLLSSLLIALLLAGCGDGTEQGALTVSPRFPGPEDEVMIRYLPGLSGSCLERSDSLELRISFLNESGGTVSEELPMRARGETWNCSLVPAERMPEGPVLMVFVVQDAEDAGRFDTNGGLPWTVPFFRRGEAVRGAKYQLFRVHGGEAELGPSLLAIDEGLARRYLEEEIAANPDLYPAKAARWTIGFYDAREDSAKNDSLSRAVHTALDSIFVAIVSDGDPDTAAAALFTCYKYAGETAAGDSILEVLRGSSPESRLVELCEFEAALFPDDPEAQAERLEAIVSARPATEEAKRARDRLARIYERALDAPEKAIEMVLRGGRMDRDRVYRWALRMKDEGMTEQSERMLRRIIAEAKNDQRPERGPYSADEWRAASKRELSRYHVALASLLEKRGAAREAADLLSRLASDPSWAPDEYLLRSLAARQSSLGDENDATSTYARLAKIAVPGEEVLENWRDCYVAVHGTPDGFERTVTQIGEERRAEARERIERSAGAREAPDVAVTDPEGRVRRLSEFRGKVIFIDFWASWCGPCLRSLPRLDEVAREWIGEEDVVIIPLNTWERGSFDERRRSIEEKWTELGVDLPVYLDANPDGEPAFPAADLFHVMSIPRSVIVGRNGKVLFEGGGLFDETDAEELRLQIEFALSARL